MSNYIELYRCHHRLGEMLRERCPDNDCRIYLNLYMDYEHVVNDYKSVENSVSETTLNAIGTQINSLASEISDMYFHNYAIERYKEENSRNV